MLRHVWVSPCWHHNCRMCWYRCIHRRNLSHKDVDTNVHKQKQWPCNLKCRPLSFMLWFGKKIFHTGGVRVLCFIKSAIPCSLATRVNSHVNPKLMRSIRVWQWRWMNSKSKNLLEVTGRSLKKRMAMWEEENIARVFKSKFPVNYRTSSKMHFKFPGNFKPILWNESIVSPWRKRHFFQNAHNCCRGFPPDGKILMLQSYSIIAFADITHTSFQDMPTEEIGSWQSWTMLKPGKHDQCVSSALKKWLWMLCQVLRL